MLVTINAQNYVLDWAAKGINRIAQNVFNLISTIKYEVAYDRTLGMDSSYVDKPSPVATAQAIAQVYDIIAEREPRASVESVNFKSIDDAGNVQLEVVIDI